MGKAMDEVLARLDDWSADFDNNDNWSDEDEAALSAIKEGLKELTALRTEVEELKGEREESIERIYHYINLNKFVPAGDEEISEGEDNLWHHNAVHKERVCGEIRKLIEQEGA